MEQTLLLVDDEPNVLKALKRVLSQDGYKVFTAANGKEGLEVLAQNSIQVVISDQRMPMMTGIEFLSQVQQLYPEIIRMLLSAHAEFEDIKNAVGDEIIDKYLSKPWIDDLLKQHVKEAFHKYDMKRKTSG